MIHGKLKVALTHRPFTRVNGVSTGGSCSLYLVSNQFGLALISIGTMGTIKTLSVLLANQIQGVHG